MIFPICILRTHLLTLIHIDVKTRTKVKVVNVIKVKFHKTSNSQIITKPLFLKLPRNNFLISHKGGKI